VETVVVAGNLIDSKYLVLQNDNTFGDFRPRGNQVNLLTLFHKDKSKTGASFYHKCQSQISEKHHNVPTRKSHLGQVLPDYRYHHYQEGRIEGVLKGTDASCLQQQRNQYLYVRSSP
jgi:hypothetical protein